MIGVDNDMPSNNEVELVSNEILNLNNIVNTSIEWSQKSSKYKFDQKYQTSKSNMVSAKKLLVDITNFILEQRKNLSYPEFELNLIAESLALNSSATVDTTPMYSLSDRIRSVKEAKQNVPFESTNWNMDLASIPAVYQVGGIVRFYGIEAAIARLIREFRTDKDTSVRVVFTPSYGRATSSGKTSAIFSDPAASVWNAEDVIHIIVVRPFELKAYEQTCCPKGYVVATFPDNEESVGTARYWCVIIAQALRLPWAFMIDDSIQGVKIPIDKNVKSGNYTHKSILYGARFLEMVVANLGEVKHKIGVLGLRRFGPTNTNAMEVALNYCQNFQYLHVDQLVLKQVNFRKGLYSAEDIVFSQECCNKGIGSFRINHTLHCDANTIAKFVKDSGAHSPNTAVSPIRVPGSRVTFTHTDNNNPLSNNVIDNTGDNVYLKEYAQEVNATPFAKDTVASSLTYDDVNPSESKDRVIKNLGDSLESLDIAVKPESAEKLLIT